MRLIKFFLFIVTFIIISGEIHSQQNINKGVIKGIIVDGESGNPMEFASIAVQKSADSSVVTGGLTNPKGEFSFANVPFGQYILKYSFVGYKSNSIDSISITEKNSVVDLGKILVTSSTQNMDAVVVTGEKALYQNKIDRKVFNVDKTISGQSGSASDILQYVPSVNVDIDGNVSLRGSENVTVLINGKPSMINENNKAAILQQIPANTINRIEVITNPSARFDPDGTSGIINIVLKEGVSQGFNGSTTVNAGSNFKSIDRFNGSLNFNYNPGKYNLSASYSYRSDDRNSIGGSERQIIKNDTSNFSNEISSDTHKPESHMFRLGYEYFFSENTSLGATGSFQFRDNPSSDKVNYDFRNFNNVLYNSTFRNTIGEEGERDLEASLFFDKKINNKGIEWRTEFNMTREDETEKNSYFSGTLYPAILEPETQEKETSKNNQSDYTLQSDLILQSSEKTKIELGYKGVIRTTEDDLSANNLENGAWVKDMIKTNFFSYKENIHSIYGTYAHEFNKFSFQTGLRLEQALTKPELRSDTNNIKNNYFSFFPTIHLSEKLNENNELSLSYSRRINRPRLHNLNPFPDYSNLYSISTGNPNLKPEYINSFEFSYIKKVGELTFQPTAFYRITENGFTRVNRAIDSIRTKMTTENLSKTKSFGAEMILNWQLLKFWNINLSATGYQYQIDATNLNISDKKERFSWGGKIMSNTNLPFKTALQLTYFYRSSNVTAQGKSDPFNSFNLGIKKDLLKSKAIFTISVSDLFNTQKFAMSTNTADLISNMLSKRESRIIYAGFTYKFGKVQKNGEKQKKEINREGEDIQEDMPF
jgi:outer membrane receptor protein involved in Fe transport